MTRPSVHSDSEREVLARLQALGLIVESGQPIGGYQPDFVIRTADGRTIVLEVKGWAADPSHVDRAKRQVLLYKQALGADAGFVVMPNVATGNPREGVLSFDDLQALPNLIGTTVPQEQTQASRRSDVQENERIIFAAMPFAPEFDDVFFVAMTHAAREIGAVCKRVDHEDFSGDIVLEIKRLIRSSKAVIADLSSAHPNVLYELGYAQGLPRPTVHITSTSTDALPFDVRNWNVLPYTAGQTHRLREPLKKRLEAVISDV